MAPTLKQQLDTFDAWKDDTHSIIDRFQDWLDYNQLSNTEIELQLIRNKRLLIKNTITVAFAAEFSRGKTELINALFFPDFGLRILPSTPGRTTMCPTEIFHDNSETPYLRLLDIETRLSDHQLADYKDDPRQWTHIELDCDSPESMRDAFTALLETKMVSPAEAIKLGLLTEADSDGLDQFEIPRWRHALISFPHPLLESGLTILDTPGLNALGSEPELTLNMLPNAQVMIFVLAADTGVTQSDMQMWQRHTRNYRDKHPNSLAVILNKIDGLKDELLDHAEVQAIIAKQVKETAKLLELDESLIFPLSAKQALIAKIKNNQAAINDSQIAPLESFLSAQVIGSQRDILQVTVIDALLKQMKASSILLNNRVRGIKRYLKELNRIRLESAVTTTELILAARQEQTNYNKNIAYLKTSRFIFNEQLTELEQLISPTRAQTFLDNAADGIRQQWHSIGIRQSMQASFDDFSSMLNETVSFTSTSIKVLNRIYKKFRDEHQLTSQQPEPFDMSIYHQQLEQLLEQGIEYSTSPGAALTEKNMLAKRFVNTIGEKAIAVFEAALMDVKRWKKSALAPLMAEIKEQREQVEHRLKSLKSIANNKEALEDKIKENNGRLINNTKELVKIKELVEKIDVSQLALNQAPEQASQAKDSVL